MNLGCRSRRCDILVVLYKYGSWVRLALNQEKPKLIEILMIRIHRPMSSRRPCHYCSLALSNLYFSVFSSMMNIVNLPQSYLSSSGMAPSVWSLHLSRLSPRLGLLDTWECYFEGIFTKVGGFMFGKDREGSIYYILMGCRVQLQIQK